MKEIWYWLKRLFYKKKLKKNSFPDKCETCAFMIKYDRSKEDINKMFEEFLILKKYGLSPYPNRVMEIGNVKKTYHGSFCALGLNKNWGPHKKHIKCKARQIKLTTSEMILSDYISIHQSIVSFKVGRNLNWLAIAIAALTLLISFVMYCK